MDHLNGLAQGWWEWMVPMFWQVSLLVVAVAVIDRVLERRVWPQVRYALWLLVFVKLVLPPSLSSPVSLTGFFVPEKPVERVPARPPTREAPAMAEDIPEMPSGESVGPTVFVPITIVPESRGIPRRRISLSWQAYLMLAWLLAAGLLAGWAADRYRRLRRSFLDGDSGGGASAEFRGMVRSTATALSLERLPRVVFSAEIRSPAVFGLFRPVLVVPDQYRDGSGVSDLRYVLLHELAHVRRGDLFVHAAGLVLQILYWFHPLLWFASRRLRSMRELCCDATVAGVLREETPEYREALLRTAEGYLGSRERFGVGLLGLLERPGGLAGRLRWLEGEVWRRRGLRMAVVLLTVAAMAVLVLPMAGSRSDEVIALETKPADREAEVGGRTLAELNMSPDVRRTWERVLEEAGLDGDVMGEIVLPDEPQWFGSPGFRLYRIDPAGVRGLRFSITVYPETGELILWQRTARASHRKQPTKSVEEIRERVEQLADLLLPAQRKLTSGPEYRVGNGYWRTRWEPVSEGVPFHSGLYEIGVDDEDLSLHSYRNTTLLPSYPDGRPVVPSTEEIQARIREILDGLREDAKKAWVDAGLTEEQAEVLLNGPSQSQKTQTDPPLTEAGTGIQELRHTAAQELADLGPGAVPEILETRHRTVDDYVVGPVTRDAILRIGKPAAPYLIEALSDERSEMRRHSASLLGGIGDRRAVEPLIALLSDPDDRVIQTAVWSLGRIGDQRAADPLMKAWEEVPDEKGMIAEALLAIGDERIGGPAREELEKVVAETEKSGDWNSKSHEMVTYAKVLGTFHDRDGIPILTRMLSAPPQTTKNPERRYIIAEGAADALRSMGLAVSGDVKDGGYRVVEVPPPKKGEGVVVFADGTVLTGKVFINRTEGDWSGIGREGNRLVFITRNGEIHRPAVPTQLRHTTVFVKTEEGWRPAMGESWPFLVQGGERRIQTAVFGPPPTEPEKEEFREYLGRWMADHLERIRRSQRESIRNMAKLPLPPGSDDWPLEARDCYRNLMMIREAMMMWRMMMNPNPGDCADLGVVFEYFSIEEPECPAGGSYAVRNMLETCSLHGTTRDFTPVVNKDSPGSDEGSGEESRADEDITDHNTLKPAYRHLFQGEYDAAYSEASRISTLDGLDPSILVRAYSIMTTALTFQGEEEAFKEFLDDMIAPHSNDDRTLSPNRPIPLSRYCRIIARSQETFRLQRLGRYREAAEAYEEQLREHEQCLKYFPASLRPQEEFIIRSIHRTEVGDLYRFAGHYEKAAEAYEAALKYLTEEYVEDESLNREVAVPMPVYLREKLPRVIAWCRMNPDELEVRLGRNVDTPLELAESHLNRGNTYKDPRSIQQGLESLASVETWLEKENILESLPDPLRTRYAEKRDEIGKMMLWANELVETVQ